MQSSSTVTQSLTVIPLLFASCSSFNSKNREEPCLGRGSSRRFAIYKNRPRLFTHYDDKHHALFLCACMLSNAQQLQTFRHFWSDFSHHTATRFLTPPGRASYIRTIPSSATSQVQPADMDFLSYMILTLSAPFYCP